MKIRLIFVTLPIRYPIKDNVLTSRRIYSSQSRVYSTNKHHLKFLNDIYLGIKKGYNIPILPPKLYTIHNSLLCRAFRVIGGISILLCISGNKIFTEIYYIYLILPIAFIYSLYNIYMFYQSVKYVFKLWKDGKLDVRNSPINHLSTYISKSILCFKVGCTGIGMVGTTMGVGFGVDTFLEYSNRRIYTFY